MEDKVLFLDFDGVLFDTLQEVYLINRFVSAKTDIFAPCNAQNYALYSKYKFLVYNIWMFYYYNKILFNNPKEDEIVDIFQDMIQKRNKFEEEKFCDEFLKARYDLVKNHNEFWRNLEVPYDFFYGIKELYDNKKPNIVVASKKNKKSILERFETYNFDLDEKYVFAREILDGYMSKGDFIDQYMKENNFKTAIFVDDNLNNIKTIKNDSTIKGLLALWGNTQPNAKGYNQQEALDIINDFF